MSRLPRLTGLAIAATFTVTAAAPVSASAQPAASTASAAAEAAAPASQAAVSSYETTVGGDPATVYHPAAGADLPVALLLQGANVGRAHYEAYARIVASHGFAVVVPDHTRIIFGVPGLYPVQEQAARTVLWAKAENATATGPLTGRIDVGSLVLIGHSFGGVAGLHTLQGPCQVPFCVPPGEPRPAELKAAVFHGTNTADPASGGVLPIDTHGIPVALVQGDRDGLALPAQAEQTYSALVDGPASLVTITGANHYSLTNTQNPTGARPDLSPPTLAQTAAIETSARWTALYLRARLGDGWAAAYLYSGLADFFDASVTVQHRS
ncbi:alpha/beta hydrolase family protein [Yinghuangia soli]|uniref:Alpha/beta hydrolase n=1 Tax=Yinghuangia soli TaxID=2908204 RepID=A0AA41U398_9ACTN|nr:hypothetical protein [Yinghuangia soli]MCF2531556.1 hypothetical protein [Yinghuangia soli]